jgi:uncharacterized membrane-anchored protein YjiN (DUF445 family)
MGIRVPGGIDRWAKGALVAALAVAIVGKVVTHLGSSFWGGLLFTLGEAALVGGLADWFAVRALFVHPLGLKIFPHTALIPRNRGRIIREIRTLVEKEWLPRELLVEKVRGFDFVREGLLPVLEPLRPHLCEVLRGLALDLVRSIDPRELAGFFGRAAGGAINASNAGPFLADLTARVQQRAWLEPLLREWVHRLQQWAETPESRATILARLRHAATAYRERGWFKRVTLSVAEAVGGVDLEAAATVLQAEIQRFAADQLAEESQMQQIVHDGLAAIERRLREEPKFLADIRNFLVEQATSGSLPVLLVPVIGSLKEEALRELAGADSRLLAAAMTQLDTWFNRLGNDPQVRDRFNGWCRNEAVALVVRHHTLLGALAEEQMNRLSDENLTELIEDKVGDDLNWIRINGTVVGGLVGVLLYLAFGAFGSWR